MVPDGPKLPTPSSLTVLTTVSWVLDVLYVTVDLTEPEFSLRLVVVLTDEVGVIIFIEP